MQIQIIYNTTEPGYRKTRRSTMPATLTHQLLEYQKLLKQLELYSKYFQLSQDSLNSTKHKQKFIIRIPKCEGKHTNITEEKNPTQLMGLQ